MKRRHAALRLTVYLAETDRVGEVPAYVELVARARKAGLAGATVVREIEGFGAAARIHARRPHSIVLDVPVIVTIVDTPARVRAFAASVAELTATGLAVVRPVDMITYRKL